MDVDVECVIIIKDVNMDVYIQSFPPFPSSLPVFHLPTTSFYDSCMCLIVSYCIHLLGVVNSKPSSARERDCAAPC